MGLSISDLKILTYIEVMKIIISFITNNMENNDAKDAKQEDIDKLLR
jgi:hypothetical protein